MTLTEMEKRAYLYLLYQAMLDIRILCQPYQLDGLRDLSPQEWLRRWREGRAPGR